MFLYQRRYLRPFEDKLKYTSGTIADPDMGTYELLPRPIGTHETLSAKVTMRFPLDLIRAQDTYYQTLRATRKSKFPDTASTAVASTAVSKIAEQISANTAAIR